MQRKSIYPLLPLILDRWSPRAMSGEEISENELMTLFEAARWAPSSYNGQPWRFIYAKKGGESWGKFFDLMVEFNRSWAGKAAVLVVVISRKVFDFNGQTARTHSFDAGAACENLAIQGHSSGLVVHAMEGFDYEKAKAVLGVPDDYSVEAMLAIGKLGRKEDLPAGLAEKEVLNDRRPLEEIVMEGGFRIG